MKSKVLLFYILGVSATEPYYMPGKCSSTEIHSQPLLFYFEAGPCSAAQSVLELSVLLPLSLLWDYRHGLLCPASDTVLLMNISHLISVVL